MERRKVLNYPVHVAAMVWGFESTGSHKGSAHALPVGIPQRTFLLSSPLTVPAGLPRAAPPSPAAAMRGGGQGCTWSREV